MKKLNNAIIAVAMIATPAMATELRGYGGDEMRFGSCTGTLTRVPPDHPGDPAFYEITRRGAWKCNLGSEGAPELLEVLEACAVGHSCKVTGNANNCEGADCIEFIKITAVKGK